MEAASISSVVVSPLPHSRATRRKGALVAPAMGASRASPRTSTPPMRIGTIVTEDDGARKRARSAAAARAVGKEDVVDAADPRRVVEEGRLDHADRLRAGETHVEGARQPLDVLGRRGGLTAVVPTPLVTVPDDQTLARPSGRWQEVRVLGVEHARVRESG